MTVCYDEGTLQALLDGEVTEDQKVAIDEHLLNCDSCLAALEQLRENQAFADSRLAEYLQSISSDRVDTSAAWSRLDSRFPQDQNRLYNRKGVLRVFSRYRTVAAAAVMVLALAVTFSFGSVRSAASDLLTIFRVDKIKTISINPSDMANIEKAIRDGAGQVDIKNFGKVEFNGDQGYSKVTQEEARTAVDFQLKLPASPPPGFQMQEIYKSTGGSLNLTLNTVSVNQVLKSLGSEKLLPDELNGKTFTVKIPAAVNARYTGPSGSQTMVIQSRSPELIAPVADVGAVRDALLALPFLPESLRSQLASINDWQHTFLVPDLGGNSKEVDVVGSQGVFITLPEGEKVKLQEHERAGKQDHPTPGYSNSLVWQKAGVVYAVSGPLTLEQALEVAASLK